MGTWVRSLLVWFHLVRLNLSAESAAIQQCFSLVTNQRTVLSATINQRNEHATVVAELMTTSTVHQWAKTHPL
jgi:hypothetical protein